MLSGSSAINNGDIVDALSSTNTIKMTVTSTGSVYANQAMVSLADVQAYNGTVHVLDAVILPVETVVDVAIDSPDFNSLTAAVIQEELLPALTNPLATFTVFAPTDAAFDALASALGTDINGILALSNLTDILLYHVLGSTVLSTDLTNGNVATLNGAEIIVDLTSGVMINDANVTAADVTATNGVVHVIDKVLDPSYANVNELEEMQIAVYPNPASNFVQVQFEESAINQISIINLQAQKILDAEVGTTSSTIDVSSLAPGSYMIALGNEESIVLKPIQIK